jgi:hypothetical protein
MAVDLSFLTGTGGASRGYTPAARKSDGTLATATDTPIIEISGPVLGTLADTATPDIAANNASFSLVSLLKGIVANLLALIGTNKPYQGAIAMTAGSAVAAQRAIRVVCTVAGNITLTYADGSTDTVPVDVGLTIIPGAFTQVAIPNSGGATATFANLK